MRRGRLLNDRGRGHRAPCLRILHRPLEDGPHVLGLKELQREELVLAEGAEYGLGLPSVRDHDDGPPEFAKHGLRLLLDVPGALASTSGPRVRLRTADSDYQRRFSPHLSRWLGGAGIGSAGSVALSAMKVLSSPSLILILPRSLPSLPSLTLPVPLT